MTLATARLALYGAVAGSAWGLVALALGGEAFGRTVWFSVAAAPLVGCGVAVLVHPRFEASGRRGRAGWALVSLYAGAIAFSLPMAAAQLVTRPAGKSLLGAFTEPIIGTLWGVTIPGFLIFLWPMAWATHRLIENATD